MEPTDLTVALLTEIRDEARRANERLDAVVHGQTRLFTAVVRLEDGLARVVDEQQGLAREARKLGERLDDVLLGAMGEQVRDHEAGLARL